MKDGRLFVTDTISGAADEVLSIPGETLGSPRLAANDSKLFFLRTVIGGGIWTMRFTPSAR